VVKDGQVAGKAMWDKPRATDLTRTRPKAGEGPKASPISTPHIYRNLGATIAAVHIRTRMRTGEFTRAPAAQFQNNTARAPAVPIPRFYAGPLPPTTTPAMFTHTRSPRRLGPKVLPLDGPERPRRRTSQVRLGGKRSTRAHRTARATPDDNPLRRGTNAIKGRLKKTKPHNAFRTTERIPPSAGPSTSHHELPRAAGATGDDQITKTMPAEPSSFPTSRPEDQHRVRFQNNTARAPAVSIPRLHRDLTIFAACLEGGQETET
jgi:hypothetical protein